MEVVWDVASITSLLGLCGLGLLRLGSVVGIPRGVHRRLNWRVHGRCDWGTPRRVTRLVRRSCGPGSIGGLVSRSCGPGSVRWLVGWAGPWGFRGLVGRTGPRRVGRLVSGTTNEGETISARYKRMMQLIAYVSVGFSVGAYVGDSVGFSVGL
jgi:hypothetical protein